jgi:serine/threonine-protein kinase
MSLNAARRTLSAAGLRPGETKEVHHDTVQRGWVVSTEPAAGREIRRTSKIDLVVSLGPQLFDIPSVSGKGIEEAQAEIEAAGFAAVVSDEAYSSAVAKGSVISQDPAPPAQIEKGSPIALVVSLGPELVEVPSLANKTPEEAKAALEAAGLGYRSISDFSDTVADGKAIRSDPRGGRKAPKGSTVTVAISKGPAPFPMPKLVGMSLGDAKAKAESLGLVVAGTTAVPGSDQASGTVQGQDPPAGTEVRRGHQIRLYHSA